MPNPEPKPDIHNCCKDCYTRKILNPTYCSCEWTNLSGHSVVDSQIIYDEGMIGQVGDGTMMCGKLWPATEVLETSDADCEGVLPQS